MLRGTRRAATGEGAGTGGAGAAAPWVAAERAGPVATQRIWSPLRALEGLTCRLALGEGFEDAPTTAARGAMGGAVKIYAFRSARRTGGSMLAAVRHVDLGALSAGRRQRSGTAAQAHAHSLHECASRTACELEHISRRTCGTCTEIVLASVEISRRHPQQEAQSAANVCQRASQASRCASRIALFVPHPMPCRPAVSSAWPMPRSRRTEGSGRG